MPRDVFAGKTAIVTGGGSGIGRALGAELVRHGADVVLADVDGASAQTAAKGLTESAVPGTGSVVAARLDVRDVVAFRALVDEVASRHGHLDLLFNNAGITMGGSTHELDSSHWDRIIDINIKGVVNGVLTAYPLMVAQGDGHIVNTASGAGLAPAVLTVAYTTTKHAVVGLSTALRPEAALHGVRVSVLCPGAVDTPILDKGPPSDLPPRGQAMTAREYLQKVGLSPMSADRFAQRALHGVVRNKAIIVVPRSAKAIWYLHRLSPGLIDLSGRSTARRILKDLSDTRLSIS